MAQYQIPTPGVLYYINYILLFVYSTRQETGQSKHLGNPLRVAPLIAMGRSLHDSSYSVLVAEACTGPRSAPRLGSSADARGLYRALRAFQPASPRNRARERLTLTMAMSSSDPKAGPILSAFTVIGLSSMICDGARRPFPASASTVRRSRGASTSVEVTGSTTTDAVPGN